MKLSKRTFLIYESILALFIVLSPYLLYLYLNIPKDVEEYDTIFGTIKGGHYITVQNYIYFFFSKFIPLSLLTILYLTHKKWWSHTIIIPISTYLFQLISVINDSVSLIDEIEFIYTTPIIVIVIIPLFLLKKKLAIYISATDLKKEMDTIIKKKTN